MVRRVIRTWRRPTETTNREMPNHITPHHTTPHHTTPHHTTPHHTTPHHTTPHHTTVHTRSRQQYPTHSLVETANLLLRFRNDDCGQGVIRGQAEYHKSTQGVHALLAQTLLLHLALMWQHSSSTHTHRHTHTHTQRVAPQREGQSSHAR